MKARERDGFLRAAWRVLVAGGFEARNFVFVDECGSHTSLAPVYGYSPRGERVHLEVPRNRGPNTTLLASMSVEGMGECLAVEGAATKILFETYVERMLAPGLRAGQVVVMDNLSATKVRGSENLSRRGAASFCICLHTRRISIPSRRRSRR